MSPPRLTGALRSFSSVSKKEEQTEQLYDLKVRQDERLYSRGGIEETMNYNTAIVETCAATKLSSNKHYVLNKKRKEKKEAFQKKGLWLAEITLRTMS